MFPVCNGLRTFDLVWLTVMSTVFVIYLLLKVGLWWDSRKKK